MRLRHNTTAGSQHSPTSIGCVSATPMKRLFPLTPVHDVSLSVQVFFSSRMLTICSFSRHFFIPIPTLPSSFSGLQRDTQALFHTPVSARKFSDRYSAGAPAPHMPLLHVLCRDGAGQVIDGVSSGLCGCRSSCKQSE